MCYHCRACLAVLTITIGTCNLMVGEEVPTQFPSSHSTRVAVVDIARVFRNYTPFLNGLEELKREADFSSETRCQSGIRCGNSLHLGTRSTSAMPLHHGANGMSKKEFVTREAMLYYATYSKFQDELANYCRENDIQLVLRITEIGSSEELQKTVRIVRDSRSCGTSWRRQIGIGQVFWASDDIDATDEIIARMNRRAIKK